MPMRAKPWDVPDGLWERIEPLLPKRERSFFFFSSRRRHTRWTGDWSSDVCSSDLKRSRIVRDRDHAALPGFFPLVPRRRARSEEHTSELQSPVHLVCRLLLEKK